ncbi:MAG: SGNH/GDSL hydrolase family protein, partial [Bacteroidota bacterium]
QVKKRVLRLPEPPGDRAGVIGEGPALSVLIVGDSSGAGVGASHQDEALLGQAVGRLAASHRVTFQLIAKTGATTRSTLRRLEREPRRAFDIAVTALGVNDVIAGRSLNTWRSEQRLLLGRLREQFGAGTVIVSGLPPVSEFPALPQPLRWYLGRRAQDFDDALRALAEEEGAQYLPLDFDLDVTAMATDGFHPGPPAYAEWGRAATGLLERT